MKDRSYYLENINEEINNLYITEDYYLSIPSGEVEFQDYWNIQIDPDGRRRDRLKEKDFFLEDIKYIIETIETLPEGNILDIGSGPGWLLSSLNNNWNKFAIEPVTEAADCVDKNITVFNNFLEEIDFEDNFFDVIVMHHSIEHMTNPKEAIEKCKKIMKKDGLIIIGTPDFDSAMARKYNKNYRLLHDPTHISLFTSESMHRFLRDNSFKILKVEYPFFGTRFFTEDNLIKLLSSDIISPPFYGSFMTFFAKNNK